MWKTIQKKFAKDQNHHCHYIGKYKGAARSIFNLIFNVLIQILLVLVQIIIYHFIIKQLAKEIEGPFDCLGENTKKNKSFPIPIEK